MAKGFYRRHLPHFPSVGRNVFVTWNLKGALPAKAVTRIREDRVSVGQHLGRIGEADDPSLERESLLLEYARRVFRISEEFLDGAETGPRYLSNPYLASIISDVVLEGATRWYLLFAFVVMPNHVHILMRPNVELSRITMGIKRKTAKSINAHLGTPGRIVWQDESFDHFPRDESSFLKIIRYIEKNPVAAGLCRCPEEWRYSSAPPRAGWPTGTPYGNPDYTR